MEDEISSYQNCKKIKCNGDPVEPLSITKLTMSFNENEDLEYEKWVWCSW